MHKNITVCLICLLISCLGLKAKPLRVAFVGDPQVNDAQELEYARKSVFRDLRERKDLDLVLILGDLVNNDTSLLPAVKASLDSLPCPWFSVPGNHDRNPSQDGSLRNLSDWKSVIGYCDTSFVYSGVRFILMNDMISTAASDYRTGFSEDQKQYLRSLFSTSSEQVLLLTHVPLHEAKGLDSLKAIFELCPKLNLVSAHTHKVRRGSIKLNNGHKIDNLVVGASCGSWWRGKKDSFGVPYAVQNCGSPRGYFIAEFSSQDYSLEYIPVGDNTAPYSAYLVGNELVINIFGGSTEAAPQIRFPSGQWQTLQLYSQTEPGIQALIEQNQQLTAQYRRSHKSEIIPLRKIKSHHTWSITLSEDQAAKIIKEFDRNPGDDKVPAASAVPTNIRLRYSDPHYKLKIKRLAISLP